MPSCSQFVEVIVPEAHNRVQAAKAALLEGAPDAVLVTDGWQGLASSQGVPLITVSILLSNRKRVFIKAVNVAGVVRSAAWIATFHEHEIRMLEYKHGLVVVGVVMDGTGENQAAWHLLTKGSAVDTQSVKCEGAGVSPTFAAGVNDDDVDTNKPTCGTLSTSLSHTLNKIENRCPATLTMLPRAHLSDGVVDESLASFRRSEGDLAATELSQIVASSAEDVGVGHSMIGNDASREPATTNGETHAANDAVLRKASSNCESNRVAFAEFSNNVRAPVNDIVTDESTSKHNAAEHPAAASFVKEACANANDVTSDEADGLCTTGNTADEIAVHSARTAIGKAHKPDTDWGRLGVAGPAFLKPTPGYTFQGSGLFVVWSAAHVFRLAINDAATAAPCIEAALAAGVTISEAVNSHDASRCLLAEAQQHVGSASTPLLSPTTSERLVLMKSVFSANRDALRHMVKTPAWRSLQRHLHCWQTVNDSFGSLEGGTTAEAHACVVDKLLSPFESAAHGLGHGLPLASFIAPVWESLLQHTSQWAYELTNEQCIEFAPEEVRATMRARFDAHVQMSPVIGIAALLEPIHFICNRDGVYMCDILRWRALFGRIALQAMEAELVRVAVALGHDREATLKEWRDFTVQGVCMSCNREIEICLLDRVEVDSWLLLVDSISPHRLPAPASDAALTARLRVWEMMGKANDDLSSSYSYPILAAVASRALVQHASSLVRERDWSTWKRLCHNSSVLMTAEHAQQRLDIAEFHNSH